MKCDESEREKKIASKKRGKKKKKIASKKRGKKEETN